MRLRSGDCGGPSTIELFVSEISFRDDLSFVIRHVFLLVLEDIFTLAIKG